MLNEQYDKEKNDNASLSRYQHTMQRTVIFGEWYDDGFEANTLRTLLCSKSGLYPFVSPGDYDFEKIRCEDESFDTVTSFEVLEHLHNPLFHLCELVRVLKYGGQIYISVPDGDCFKSKVQRFLGKTMKYHINEPLMKTFTIMATLSGLKYFHIESYPMSAHSGLLLSRFGMFNRGLFLMGVK